jgi:hypothetical protein
MKIKLGKIILTIIAIGIAGGLIVFAQAASVSRSRQIAGLTNNAVVKLPSPTRNTFPSVLPTPTATTRVTNTIEEIDDSQDPIIDCVYPHLGTIRMKKSECDGKKVECQIASDKWQVVWKENCDALRAKEAEQIETLKRKLATQNNSYKETVYCVLSYGTYKVEPSYCDSLKQLEKRTQEMRNDPLPTFDLGKTKAFMDELNKQSEEEAKAALDEFLSRQQARVNEFRNSTKGSLSNLSTIGKNYLCQTPFGQKPCKEAGVGAKPLCKTAFGTKPCSEGGGTRLCFDSAFGIKECS